MASCNDDDFSLLNDDHHHHHHHHHHHLQSNPNNHHPHQIHQSFTPHRFSSRSSSVHAPPPVTAVSSAAAAVVQPIIDSSVSPKKIGAVEDEEEEEDEGDDYGDAAFCSSSFDDGDPNRVSVGVDVRIEKRKDEEIGEEAASYSYKRAKASSSGGGEYRKDREEWSDAAISCLLDAYTEKFTQLNRGNLRGRDWEEVAAIVSERCEKQSKSVEQCKNKVDNLKKRYKLERHRMTNGGISISHWPWFKQMEQIVGNSLTVKVVSDEDRSVGSSGNTPRVSKRYAPPAANTVGQMNNIKPKSVSSPRWRRVVFKISGAALSGTGPNNIDSKVAMTIARDVANACRLGVEVAIVVGGRNFFCGDSWVTTTGLDRCTAYQIGYISSPS